jgi:hypothetical protein
MGPFLLCVTDCRAQPSRVVGAFSVSTVVCEQKGCLGDDESVFFDAELVKSLQYLVLWCDGCMR